VPPSVQSGTVVVAAVPLGFGAALTRENVTEIPWASGKMPEGGYATKDELFKDGRRVALAPLQRNELILKTKITEPGQRASLSSLLDDGKRGVTVRVGDIRGVLDRIGSGPSDETDWLAADLNRARTELKPGTLLTREWSGHLQRVMALADGFSWNGSNLQPDRYERSGPTCSGTTENARKLRAMR
jgi:Flp pilus assembly protein CpaB